MPVPMLDRLLGAPEGAPPQQLRRALGRGSPALRARALREIGRRDDVVQALPILQARLHDAAPAPRRAAAWALGQVGVSAPAGTAAHLLALASTERCDEVRLAMAVAAVRCGASVAEGWAVLARASVRRLATWYGPRSPAEVVGAGPGEQARRWRLCLGDLDADQPPDQLSPQPPGALRAAAQAALVKDPEDRGALQRLAAQQHPDDLAVLLRQQTGRRTRHAATAALGTHGDPRAVAALVQTMGAVVDPGQGFANRRIGAEALGRLGVPAAGRVLARALETEALEFEGRPGAGLGVQFPVRSVLLAALGEAGATEYAALLAGYLANTHGSALGGFYLPAMDALWKLGRAAAVPVLQPLLRSDEELVVANALGVLGALGEVALVAPFRSDARARVARAAQGAEEEVAVPDQRFS